MRLVICIGWAAITVWAVLSIPANILAQTQHVFGHETLASINGSPITRLQLDQEKRLLNAAVALDSPGIIIQQVEVSDSDLLEQLIDRELIVQQAVANQTKVRSRYVDDALKDLKSRFDDASEYEQYLVKIKMTEMQLTEHLRTGLMIKRYLQGEVIQNVRVSDDELKSFYSRHPEDFIRPPQVRALHLMVAVKAEEQRAEALIKMQAIQLELAQGADFGVTALENSDCPSHAKGGDLGYFTYNQVITPVADVAFALEPGQTSWVVASSLGYHLVKVIDRKPPSRIAFKDVRDRIEGTIRRNKENQALASYLTGLRKEAEIIRYSISP